MTAMDLCMRKMDLHAADAGRQTNHKIAAFLPRRAQFGFLHERQELLGMPRLQPRHDDLLESAGPNATPNATTVFLFVLGLKFSLPRLADSRRRGFRRLC